MQTIERFMTKVFVTPSGCWEWTAARYNGKTPAFNAGYRTISARVFIWEYEHGSKPPSLIYSTCHNSGCVNPAHLVAPTDTERFEAKIDRSGECWLWTGGTIGGPQGYGQFTIGHRNILAHRFSYSARFGEIPARMDVLHRCDTPSCVRPDHLFLGTDADNSADKIAKQRQSHGEGHGHAKLSAANVGVIRRSRASALTLATRFGVTRSCIYNVRAHKHWKHL